MKISATEFKAKCLAILDAVHERGEVVRVTKRGRVVASTWPRMTPHAWRQCVQQHGLAVFSLQSMSGYYPKT